MMELKEPKRKRRVPHVEQQPFPIPIGGISAISGGHWQIYYGSYLGDCVVVEDPNDMAALHSKGFFGKGSLSRDMPKFHRGGARTPTIIRQRQWERRCKWAEKQRVMISDLQQMFSKVNNQNVSEQTSNIPSKDTFLSADVSKENESENEKATADEEKHRNDRTVDNCEADKHERNKQDDVNTSAEAELVMLESEDETREVKKPSSTQKKDDDIILLDSEEEDVAKDQKCLNDSNVSESKLASGKEVDVLSVDSEGSSIIVNDPEEKQEIIVEENVKGSDTVSDGTNRSDLKRGLTEDDDAIVQNSKKRSPGKETDDANQTEASGEKSGAPGEDEIILIDMVECSKNPPEEEKRSAEESNGEKETPKEVSQSNAMETEKDLEKTDLETSQSSTTELQVPTDETSDKTACEPENSTEAEDASAMEVDNTENADSEAEGAATNQNQTAEVDNITATEKTEESGSKPDQTKDVSEMEVDSTPKEADVPEVNADNRSDGNRSGDEDDEDLVLVLSDGDSDSEEYAKNLKPRIEKEKFPVRETLQLMLEEAFFLSFGLGCLQVVDMCSITLSLTDMWQLFRKSDPNFTSKYIAYHYFRSKGWVVKPGIKFAGDFLLYKQGPSFYHSSYIVIVETLDGKSWIPDSKVTKSLTWTKLHGLVRLAETSGKEILLCQVIKPSDVTPESMESPSVISKFKVHEQLIRRWVSSEEREEEDSID